MRVVHVLGASWFLRRLFFIPFVLLAACATVPDTMQVTRGVSPKNVDKNVRFRTTYFYRVFDYCRPLRCAQGDDCDALSVDQILPQTDTLYRFVMTGKANAYANYVQFESGTLKASQIDPFGATVARDEDTGRFRFVSSVEEQERLQFQTMLDRVKKLNKLKRDLSDNDSIKDDVGGKPSGNNDLSDSGKEDNEEGGEGDTTEVPVPGPASNEVVKTIEKQIIALLNNESNLVTDTVLSTNGANGDQSTGKQIVNIVNEGSALLPDLQRSQSAGYAKQRRCAEDTTLRRGFQLMGPQGIKTFDQDERLIMAMSSNAGPLIGALQEISGRYLEAQKQVETQTSETHETAQLAEVREQLRVSQLQLKLEQSPSPDPEESQPQQSTVTLLCDLMTALGADEACTEDAS